MVLTGPTVVEVEVEEDEEVVLSESAGSSEGRPWV